MLALGGWWGGEGGVAWGLVARGGWLDLGAGGVGRVAGSESERERETMTGESESESERKRDKKSKKLIQSCIC